MWKEHIPNCFGSVDGVFANHPAEIQNAFQMLSQAINENVSWKTYLAEVRTYLKTIHSQRENVEKQMRRVKNLSNYFSSDV